MNPKSRRVEQNQIENVSHASISSWRGFVTKKASEPQVEFNPQPRPDAVRALKNMMNKMKTLVAHTIAVFCGVALTGVCHASLIAYEPFNYITSIPTGTASTASGFAGNWTCGTTPSIVTGMTYPDLPVANGALSSTSGRQFVSLAVHWAAGPSGSASCSVRRGTTAGIIAASFSRTAARDCSSGLGSRRSRARKAGWASARSLPRATVRRQRRISRVPFWERMARRIDRAED
jgi:hypothetical protein